MASDDRNEFLEGLAAQMSEVQVPETRAARETRPVAPMMRRQLINLTPPEHVRTSKINIRVTPRQKQRITARAMQLGLSLTEYLIRLANADMGAAK